MIDTALRLIWYEPLLGVEAKDDLRSGPGLVDSALRLIWYYRNRSTVCTFDCTRRYTSVDTTF